MFCTNCGAQIADGSKFCTNCGAQFGAPAPAAPAAAAGGAVAVATKKKTKLLPIIIIAAIVVIAAIVLIIVLGGGGKGGYEKVIDSYFTAFEKGDEKAVVKLIYPTMIETYKLYMGDDEEDLVEIFDPYYDIYKSKVKSYEIKDTEEVDKKELKEMQDDLKDAAAAAALMGQKIKVKNLQAAVTVEVEANIKGEGDCDFEFGLVKTGGKWYIASIED